MNLTVLALERTPPLSLINITLEVCGLPWLIIVGLVALLNFVIALRLVFSAKSVVALVAFMPVVFLPFVIGVVGAALGLLQALEVSIGGGELDTNPALLLSWAMLPMLIGGSLSAPAYVTASLGRLWLATRGVSLKPSKSSRQEATPAKKDESDSAYQAYADLVTTKGHRK